MFFKISLAQWSLHHSLFNKEIDNLDFPSIAKHQYGIDTVEYVNLFFMDKAEDTIYLNELNKRCSDNNIKNHLIMCDNEGMLGSTYEKERKKSVENHFKWINAAKYLGCSTIRVNTYGDGTPEEIKKASMESLSQLGEYAAKENMNIVVENHGGITSNAVWLASLISLVDKNNVGTLPDLGNFCLKRNDKECEEEYDRYKGVSELMPHAKAVSAKTQNFDSEGNCTETDYYRMLKIIKDSGFTGYMGIEYGGELIGEEEGIRKTMALLEKTAAKII